VQEEFRRYRVRSEITRKQKDAEIRKVCCCVDVCTVRYPVEEADGSRGVECCR
jgi:hypothetical protein